jgi:RNA polymerase sigma-70 factor, ECF subfamily
MGTKRLTGMCDTTKTRVSLPALLTANLSGKRIEHAADCSLVREAQRGDKAAFEELVHRYDRAVLSLAVHLTGSEQEAQDIYQEAFLQVYKNLPSFRFECSFYIWVYRVVSNLCLKHLREKHLRSESVHRISGDGKEELVNFTPGYAAPSSPERSPAALEPGQSVVRALLRLSPRERMVFELRHYHGLKLRTVAGILNMTDDATKNTLLRATQKLRTQLAEAS